MKILIGYDGSKAADEAIEDLRKAGLPAKAQAFILTSVPPLLPLDFLGGDPTGSSLYSTSYVETAELSVDLKARAKTQSEKAARALRKLMPGWTVTSGTCEDVPSHGILEKADAWKPDLIVVGSHGWSEFGNLLLGSVADQVLRHSHADVRVARKPARRRSGLTRLLIGFDGSPHAEATIAEVASRDWPKGTRVDILAASVMRQRLDELGQAIKKALNPNASDADAWPWMERALDKAVTRLNKAGLKATAMITVDDPRKALVEAAKETGADCIFLGSRGLSGVKRFLLGSVSAAVAAHAPCSVEIIHAPAKKTGK